MLLFILKGERIMLSEFTNELDDFIAQEYINTDTYKAEEGFEITDKATANFVIKRLKDNLEQQKQIEDDAKEALNDYRLKVELFKEHSLSPLKYLETIYKNQLTEYLKQNLPKNKKSIKLVNGTIGFRKQKPAIEYDEPVLLEYLQKNHLDKYIRLTPSINKQELTAGLTLNLVNNKASIPENNNTYDKYVPGIKVEVREDAFSIK
jgi:phage host-nuclease inhibitor protein Gam